MLRVQDFEGTAGAIVGGRRTVGERRDREVRWTYPAVSRCLAAIVVSRGNLPIGPAFEWNKQRESARASGKNSFCDPYQNRTRVHRNDAHVCFRSVLYHLRTSEVALGNDLATITPRHLAGPSLTISLRYRSTPPPARCRLFEDPRPSDRLHSCSEGPQGACASSTRSRRSSRGTSTSRESRARSPACAASTQNRRSADAWPTRIRHVRERTGKLSREELRARQTSRPSEGAHMPHEPRA